METELRVVFFGNAYFVSDAIYAALQESDCRIVAGVLPPVSARKRASSVRRLHDLWNRVRPVERAKPWRNYARMGGFGQMPPEVLGKIHTDRKSTRLNSSHVKISYAVFCLKKNKQHIS